jgi:hypothetical protein
MSPKQQIYIMTEPGTSWRPDRPHNQLPTLPPARELESRAVLKTCIEARAALAELKQAAGGDDAHVLRVQVAVADEVAEGEQLEELRACCDG